MKHLRKGAQAEPERGPDHRRHPAGRDRSCGYRVEDIEDPLMQQIRHTASAFVTVRSAVGFRERNDCSCGMYHLDKLVDGPIHIGLAKGRAMEKILRR